MRRLAAFAALLLLAALPDAAAQSPAETAAVLPAPPALRASATVLGYGSDGLTTLREGDGPLVCLADDPADDGFHVACYHTSLEPFMARGRALRAEGHDREAVRRLRGEEIAAGTLAMPDGPAMLYQLFGAGDAFDPATGTASDVQRLTVVYLPGATAETTGLPLKAPAGAPWLMNPGEPWAHVMLLGAATETVGADDAAASEDR